MMRQSETMRAASRLLLSHPIACLTAALAAVVVLGVLGPLKVVHAADGAVEGEDFTTQPPGTPGTSVVTDTRLYSNGKALKFSQDVPASHTATCGAVCDVQVLARGGQTNGSPTLSVNGSTPQEITNNGAPVPYLFKDVPADSNKISITAGNTGTGRNPFVDVVTFSGGTDTTPPDTIITSPQDGDVIATAVTFEFRDEPVEPGSTFQCKLVGLDLRRFDCISGQSYTNLTAGTEYTFKVWAQDAAGNMDTTPATFTFTPSDSTPPACADGEDNDLDGLTDYPSDLGCTSITDTDEEDVTPSLAACADGADNDGDRLVDHLNDPDCVDANDDSEAPRLVGAGDIATRRQDNDTLTGNLIRNLIEENPDLRVFTVGDNAYQDGTLAQFNNYYHPAWGSFKDLTSPTPGNHDWYTRGAEGYKQYFGIGIEDPTWYAYDLGAWRIYALDSEASMAVGSDQYNFVVQDLIDNGRPCMLAYWHHPIASSGQHGNDPSARPMFELMDRPEHDVDLVLNGHDHNYERFDKINHEGQQDPAGIQEIVVGTGGVNQRDMGTPIPGSLNHQTGTHGILDLTLNETGYTGQFIPVSGKTFTDSFDGSCG